MSKLDETMEKFDAACEGEGRAEATMILAQATLEQLRTDNKDLIEQIGQAEQDLNCAKDVMQEAAIGLHDQVDNAAFGRDHIVKEAQAEYTKARGAVSAAKLKLNTFNERAESLTAEHKRCEKLIEDARLALKRAQNHKHTVADQLRPLIASEVAGYTGRKMPKPVEVPLEDVASELPKVDGVEDASLEIEADETQQQEAAAAL